MTQVDVRQRILADNAAAAAKLRERFAAARTLVLNRDARGRQSLSVLDVMTKQVKDIGRISGNDSQPAWAK